MMRRHVSRTVAILTIAMATLFQTAEAAEAQTDRCLSIGASLFFEAPSFGYRYTNDEDGPRGLPPGVSIRIARDLSSRVSIGLEIDLPAAHISRGQSFRFDTFSPVLLYHIGSTRRWEFGVDGGLAFAYIKTADDTAKPEPTFTQVAYTVGLTAALSAQLRTTRRLTFVADLRATSLSFSDVRGFVIRPGGGIRLKF